MKSEEKKKIFAVVLFLFLVIVLKEAFTSGIEDGKILRNEPGGGERQETLEAEVNDSKYEIEVEVGERQYTKKEAKKLIQKAKQEIDETFGGKNRSLDYVDSPVVMKEAYQDGKVEAEWSLEPYDVIDAEGNFVENELSEDGELVEAEIFLTCAEVMEEYRFAFCVYPPKRSIKEQLETALKKEEQKSKTKSTFTLPKKIGGREVVWKEKSSHNFLLLLFLGPVMMVLFKLKGVEEERKKKKERELELLLYYPQLVTTLSLLMGAGMSVSRAWERMTCRYRAGKEGRRNVAYEEMCLTWNEIKDGVGEGRAYENFGNRCGLSQYKKLASMLNQNLKKGTAGMSELLAKEAELALEQRKNLAKKLGEEAGTKMLLPMMMMLVIVMVIIILPAMLSFQF